MTASVAANISWMRFPAKFQFPLLKVSHFMAVLCRSRKSTLRDKDDLLQRISPHLAYLRLRTMSAFPPLLRAKRTSVRPAALVRTRLAHPRQFSAGRCAAGRAPFAWRAANAPLHNLGR